MAAGDHVSRVRLYLGVDIGGTKIQASVAEESGAIRGRQRCPTPRDVGPEQVLAAIERLVEQVLDQQKLDASKLAAMGVAVPGVVDPELGRVVVTPNMTLTGVALGSHLEARFHVPVALGNDCNLAPWAKPGSARPGRASSALGIFVGTGIGGGFVQQGEALAGGPRSRPARSATSSCRSAARNAGAATMAAWRPWPAARPSRTNSARRSAPAARPC